ncbi:hypothetical protein JCM6882_002706 [Rhodosporidiobolus microsporus]
MAAATLMPLLAQSFLDQSPPSSSAFTTGSPRAQYGSPRRQQRTPHKSPGGKPSPSPKRRTPRSADQRSPEDVHSWSDATLAERYQKGYGNWGSVWLVKAKLEQGTPARAVKLVHRSKNPTSSARVRALWTEFKCIRTLRAHPPHPNLIAFHSFIITPSYAIITMPYHQRLMPVAIPESKAKSYFIQLLSAVEHLHQHGISHNDIKPSNILLTDAGEGEGGDRPVLIDYGFAQQYATDKPERFLSSLSWGTPEYLSPERAKGALHDERLSDVWALGVTMYEIVVGRTPFEQSEDENFLNREQLEVYYHRTLTGTFFGDYIISPEFASLIHLMVEPAVHLRMQSCAKAMRHKFFEPPASPFSTQSASSAADYTPTRTALGKPASLVQAPSPSATRKAGAAATPHKTPKTDERKKQQQPGFKIYEDEDAASAPSPARTGASTSPFSPRRDPLATRSNERAPSPAAVAAAAVGTGAPSTPKPFKVTLKKTPPPSRIPVSVRKGDISSPLQKTPMKTGAGLGLGHRRLVSSPSPSIPLRVASQPLLSQAVPPVPPVPAHLTRSTSLKSTTNSVKRKPVPQFDEVAFVQALPKTQLVMSGSSSEEEKDEDEDEDEEVLRSRETSPVWRSGGGGTSSDSAPTTPDETPTFTSRSYTIKVGRRSNLPAVEAAAPFSNLNLGEVFASDLPSLGRKSSSALASRIRKLSVKHIRRAPSAMSFAGLKSSLSGGARRRASLADSMYSMIEAERVDDQHANTMPLSLDPKPEANAEVQRAGMESFSRRIQHILDNRKVVVPLMNSNQSAPPPSPSLRSPTSPQGVARGSRSNSNPTKVLRLETPMQSVPEGSREPSPEPFSFNSTSALSPSPVASTFVASPPPRKSSLRLRTSPGRKVGLPALSLKVSAPLDHPSFKPGHRRIPTAIRNVPSVVLHESADDGDYSESDYSRADTPFERVASPPPPPRVVEPSRQLPTWVPTDASDDEDPSEDGDVDEPTIRISTPRKLSRKPSQASSVGRNVTPKASPVKPQQLFHSTCTVPVTLTEQRVVRPSLTRRTTASSSLTFSTNTFSPSSSVSGFSSNPTRPPSPSAAATTASLPFSNFHIRAASRASTLSSAASGSSSPQKQRLGHKRSRSVLSFFFRSSSAASSHAESGMETSGAETDRSCSRPVSRMSNTSSLGWSTTAAREGLPHRHAEDETAEEVGKKKKRGGRLRKVASKLFR